MKKKISAILTLVLAFSLIFTLASCGGDECLHDFENACDADCAECGYERTTTHVWNEATCYNPKTCRNCGVVEGEPLMHLHLSEDVCADELVCDHCRVMIAQAQQHQPGEDGICTICGESVILATELE